MTDYTAANLALKAVCPNNEIICDQAGDPSVMVKIPKMTLRQLGLADSDEIHPAFIINGQTAECLYIGKYESVVRNGTGHSLPGVCPTYGITKEEAYEYCVPKGRGWHLVTKVERAMLAQLCKANGFLPKGNNDFGKHVSETTYTAIPATRGEDGTHVVETGTGPLSWYHDGTASGISNLNGNIWEWVGGMRLVYGELQMLPNNDGADIRNSQAPDSGLWRAISAEDGSYLVPDGKGTTPGSIKQSWNGGQWVWTARAAENPGLHWCNFESATHDETIGAKALLMLQILGAHPYDALGGAFEGFDFWSNTAEPETAFDYSGRWNSRYASSCFNASGSHPRDFKNDFAGFRVAYAEIG